VYAVEQTDLADGVAVDDLRLSTPEAASLEAESRPDLLGGCVVVTGEIGSTAGTASRFTAVPYCLWAHREPAPMRVWLPVADAASADGTP
jgi:DUF1680 family protein